MGITINTCISYQVHHNTVTQHYNMPTIYPNSKSGCYLDLTHTQGEREREREQ